jgi:hypothetical protein
VFLAREKLITILAEWLAVSVMQFEYFAEAS